MKNHKFSLIIKSLYSSSTINASSQPLINDPSTARLLQLRDSDILLDSALRMKDFGQIKTLLTNDYFILSPDMVGKAMRIGLQYRNVDIFALAVKHENFLKVDASFGYNFAVRFAVKHKLTSLFDILMNHPRVNPYDLENSALWKAKRQGQKVVVKRLLDDPRIHTVNRNIESFWKACRYGEVELIESLLKDGNIDPGHQSNKGLSLATEAGHLETVKILLHSQGVDPSDSDNRALKRACIFGHEDVVQLLLNDPRVNPKGCLSYGCKADNVSMVKLLLEDPRMRNQFDMNRAMRTAIIDKKYEIVEYLLENTTINFVIGEIRPIVTACEEGNFRILNRLVSDRRYKVGGTSYEYFQRELKKGLWEALKRNHIGIVDFLLSETPAMPNGKDFNAAQVACRFGHQQLLIRLLKDHRVFITEKCIFKAAANNHKHIVKFLLENVEEDSVPRMLEAAREGAKRAKFVLRDDNLADSSDSKIEDIVSKINERQ